MTRSTWLLLAVLASAVAAYAVLVLLLPGFGPHFIVLRRALLPLAVVSHLTGGAVALATGAWQLNARFRGRHLATHRLMGRVYVIAVLVGGLGALRLAPEAQTGRVAALGFGILAIAWLATTLRGYRAIRHGHEAVHRRWMTRSFALTFAAVTLRIYLPASGLLRIPYELAYPAIAWLCWVPNLAVAEWHLRAGRPAESAMAA
jgi:uncharacterized membrane protein